MCCKSYFVWPWSSLILIVQSQNYFYGKSQNLWKFWDAQSTDAFSAPSHSTAKFLIIQESWNILRGHHQKEIFHQTLLNSFWEKTIIDHKILTTVHLTHLIFYLDLWYSQELDFAKLTYNLMKGKAEKFVQKRKYIDSNGRSVFRNEYFFSLIFSVVLL